MIWSSCFWGHLIGRLHICSLLQVHLLKCRNRETVLSLSPCTIRYYQPFYRFPILNMLIQYFINIFRFNPLIPYSVRINNYNRSGAAHTDAGRTATENLAKQTSLLHLFGKFHNNRLCPFFSAGTFRVPGGTGVCTDDNVVVRLWHLLFLLF